jgi:glycosidase
MMRVDGEWAVTTLIEPIGRHEYKLIVDGEWIADPENPVTSPDGFGGVNSVIDVCGASCGEVEAFDWRDSVMYFAMVDRFSDSDGEADPVAGVTGGDATSGPSGQYEGGDLQGVTDRLGYLADLGVTSIWLSAPYENRDTAGAAVNPAADPHTYSAYHGYWPKPADIDYSDPANPSPRPAVESRIGTEADLRAFVDGAHGADSANGHGIKVLFDYVMNHIDIESGLYAAHPDWIATDDGRIRNCGTENLWDDPYWGTRCAFTDYLPPLDYENPAPRAWSVADAIWWAKEYGIDGYRLDAIKHVPMVWLTDLRDAVDREITDVDDRFYMVGETYNWDQQDVLAEFIDPETKLDGQFDFPLRARLCEAVFQDFGDLTDLRGFMDANDAYYGPDAIMSTWIGNHDIPRAIHYASREITNCRQGSNPDNGWSGGWTQPAQPAPYERLAVAFAVLMTNGGVPLIYYGDEIGLAGGGDPDNRRLMPWADGDLNMHQLDLRDRVRALARARGENPVLGRGRRVTLGVDADTWVYQRVGCDDLVTVAINKADAPRTVMLPPGDHEDLLDGGTVSGGSTSLPARSFLVLR